jgi:hypothetical protein
LFDLLRLPKIQPLVLAALFFCALPFVAVGAEGLPLLRSIFGNATLGEARFRETINKLNRYGEYAFAEAYRSEQTLAFYSGRGNSSCWLKHHDSDDYADKLTQEMAEHKYPVFRYANWVGHCTAGDTEKLASQVRYILIGAGEWRE